MYDIRFLMGTVETGGVGATFNRADRLVLLEPHWMNKAEKQAYARVDRIGNPNPTVHTFRLIADVRIEKAIVARQKRRNALTEGVLDQTLIKWLEEVEQERRERLRQRQEETGEDENRTG